MTMKERPIIDVWDVTSFDADLASTLDAHAGVIRNYLETNRRQWLERQASDHTGAYPENPFWSDFNRLRETIADLMDSRTIRAWHHTRLTDDEVDKLQAAGIHMSTMNSLEGRVAAQVDAQVFSRDVGDRLLASSSLHGNTSGSRSDKFHMTSHPHEIDDWGVEDLLGYWGGEVLYFSQTDPDLQELLRTVGMPRIVEVAVPIASTCHKTCAVEATVAAFGKSIGCYSESHAFDLYAFQPLPPEAILAVHTHGDATFASVGRGYPAAFVPEELE